MGAPRDEIGPADDRNQSGGMGGFGRLESNGKFADGGAEADGLCDVGGACVVMIGEGHTVLATRSLVFPPRTGFGLAPSW
jgi:hypothetical protein